VVEYDGRAIKPSQKEFNLPNGDIISSNCAKVHSAGDPRTGLLVMKFLL